MTPATGRSRRSTRALLAALLLTMALPLGAAGAPPGHLHPAEAFATSTISGAMIVPLINSGDTRGGVTFEGIPDGIGIVPVGKGNANIDIFVVSEQSHVPFGGFADFEDSSVIRARLNIQTQQIVQLEEMLPPSAGFIRFCSASMVGPEQGFSDYTFLVNEESNDVLPALAGQPYGADSVWSSEGYRQAGYSVWLDAKTGEYQTIPGVGRMNHENTVVVPGGWNGIYALTGDDTFAAPSSQLYMYGAASEDAFKADQGSLWAFRVTAKNGNPVTATDPFNSANDFLNIAMGDTLSGTFIPVPGDIARGTHGGFPQTDLETWSNDNNVFQFVRVEDIAYDPDSPRTVYFTDTGSSRIKESASTGRLIRPENLPANKPWSNTDGRVFRMVLNASDPTVVDSLTILAQGALTTSNADGTTTTVDAGVGLLNPDNIAVGHSGLMVQEDASTNPTNNDIWNYSFSGTSWTRVATVTQPLAETSGIVDASQWLGPGWWVFDVQSHLNLELGPSGLSYATLPTGTPVLTYQTRRELGQLLMFYVPGS